MASGSEHTAANITTALIAGSAITVLYSRPESAFWVMSGCILGIPLTPDLDQIGINTFEWWLIKWTAGVGYLWLAFWGPYATFIPHRSPLSHWPILGTSIRLTYGYLGISLIGLLIKKDILPITDLLQDPITHLIFVGLCLGDLSHFILDSPLYSRLKLSIT